MNLRFETFKAKLLKLEFETLRMAEGKVPVNSMIRSIFFKKLLEKGMCPRMPLVTSKSE